MEANLILLMIFAVVVCQVLMLVYYIKGLGTRKAEELDNEKEWDLMHDAMKKSQAIRSQAELEAIKTGADTKFDLEKFEKKLEADLSLSEEEVLENVKSESAKATVLYKKYLQELLDNAKGIVADMETSVKGQTGDMLGEFGQNLDRQLGDLGKEAISAAEVEVATMKKQVADYEKKKMQEIDERGAEVLEKAAEIYVGRKLDKKEHMQIAYEALERAKREIV